MGTTSFIPGRVEELRGEAVRVRAQSGAVLWGRDLGGRHALATGQEVVVAVRPEHVRFVDPAAGAAQQVNLYQVRVARASHVGELIDYQLELRGSGLRARGEVGRAVPEGGEVWVRLDLEALPVLPA